MAVAGGVVVRICDGYSRITLNAWGVPAGLRSSNAGCFLRIKDAPAFSTRRYPAMNFPSRRIRPRDDEVSDNDRHPLNASNRRRRSSPTDDDSAPQCLRASRANRLHEFT